jgi:hypothetical protein
MLLLALTLLPGCKKVEPAPEALDDLLHYTWQKYDDGLDEELANAVINLDDAVQGGELDPPDGSISDLTDDEIALVGVTDRPAADAAGLFMTNRFTCTMKQLEEILSYSEQDELYEGVYEAYTRDFAGPRTDWLKARDQRLDYSIRYTSKIPVLGGEYDAEAQGSLRQVPTDVGRAIVQRSYMPKPADFGPDEDKKYFDHDYQLEIYFDGGGGEVVHVYGMWRSALYGGSLDTDNEALQRTILGNMFDWDDNTEKLCEEGRP